MYSSINHNRSLVQYLVGVRFGRCRKGIVIAIWKKKEILMKQVKIERFEVHQVRKRFLFVAITLRLTSASLMLCEMRKQIRPKDQAGFRRRTRRKWRKCKTSVVQTNDSQSSPSIQRLPVLRWQTNRFSAVCKRKTLIF